MSASITISEWLPNPEGKDAEGEWVELWNQGGAPRSLVGWRLENAAGKTAPLGGMLQPDERQVFHRATIKLSLRNEAEEITLFAPSGEVADTSSFLGLAPEGKSVNHEGGRTWLATPTPGAANAMPLTASIAESSYPVGAPVNAPLLSMPAALFSTALLLTFAAVAIIKFHDQKDEIPGGDQGLGG